MIAEPADTPASMAEATPYELLGGEVPLRALVDRFYALMDSDPSFRTIRGLHPENLARSGEKLFMFLSGWMGGPPLYVQRIGQPMLRARHLPFPIGSVERDQWLACMARALEELKPGSPELRVWLMRQFAATADWMRNRPGDMPGMG